MHAKDTIDFHIRAVWASISRMYNSQANEHNGTMSIGYVLLNVDKEGTPSTSLGPRMGMESTSLSRTLKRMEEQGLIYREKDVTDGRMVRIFLTDLGKEMRKLSRNIVLDFNKTVHERIPKEKLDVFFEVMVHIQSILNSQKLFKEKSAA
jgi:MarR family transcriptional regulator, organic hydroperoxide resistance regulator